MKMIELKLTPRQAEIFETARTQAAKTAVFLAGLSHNERLDWLKKHQYPYPISFEREISGTVYTVKAHFSGKTAETVEGTVERILSTNIAH